MDSSLDVDREVALFQKNSCRVRLNVLDIPIHFLLRPRTGLVLHDSMF
jgi:hypothetical protein